MSNLYLFTGLDNHQLLKFIYTLSIGIIAMASCTGFYLLKSDKITNKKWIWIIYSMLFFFALFFFVSQVSERIQTPEIWDFTAFYLYGKVAAEGYNFYLPENYHLVFNALNLPFTDYQGLLEEVVNVGCPYPPPTILYLMPLGFMPYKIALIYWTIFNLIFLAGSIYLIYSMFLKSDKLNGFMLVTTLILISPQVRSTILFSQTNFIVLFLLLMMKKYADHKYAGILLAIAFFTKPYMLIFGVFFFLKGRWKTIGYFIISAAIIAGVTLIIIGKETFFTYFTNNPTQRIPTAIFSEQINQSLHAVLLRANMISIDKPIVYLVIAALILCATLVLLIYLLKRKKHDLMWAVLLLVGLIVYPGTLSYYGVLLFFIIFQFFNNKQPLGIDMYLTIPVIGLLYFLSSVSAFSSFCFLLIVVVLIIFRQNLPTRLRTFNYLPDRY